MIIIDPKKKAYYKEKTKELIHLVNESRSSSVQKKSDNEDVQDFEGAFINSYEINEDNYIKDVQERIDDVTVLELNESSCSIINKYVKDIYGNLRRYVALETVRDLVYQWIFATYRGQETRLLCDFIEQRINEDIDTYTFYFPLPYVELKGYTKLLIGDVTIGTIDDVAISNNKILQKLNIDVCNNTFASITMEGDYKLLKEKAFGEVSFVMDIIKSCSNLKFEIDPSDFCLDIDSKNRSKAASLIIAKRQGYSKLNIEQTSSTKIYTIDNKFLQILNNNKIGAFFSLQQHIEKSEPTEFQMAVKRGIIRFSDSLSMGSRLERNVVLCSILDSFVLTSTEVAIKESLKKYIPILITTDPKSRKQAKDIINEMYSIRSNFIHHGEGKYISDKQMSLYNYFVFRTIQAYLVKSREYKELKDLYKDIDQKLDSVIL